MCPPGRLQTELLCISGVHSCPCTCLFEIFKPSSVCQFFSLHTTFFLIVRHQLCSPFRSLNTLSPGTISLCKCWQFAANHWPANIWKLPLLEDNKTAPEFWSWSWDTISRAWKGKKSYCRFMRLQGFICFHRIRGVIKVQESSDGENVHCKGVKSRVRGSKNAERSGS